MKHSDYNNPAPKFIVYPIGLLIWLLGLFLLILSIGIIVSIFSQQPIDMNLFFIGIGLSIIVCIFGLGFTQFGWRAIFNYDRDRDRGLLSPSSLYFFGILWICAGIYLAVTSKEFVNPLGVVFPAGCSIGLARHRSLKNKKKLLTIGSRGTGGHGRRFG